MTTAKSLTIVFVWNKGANEYEGYLIVSDHFPVAHERLWWRLLSEMYRKEISGISRESSSKILDYVP